MENLVGKTIKSLRKSENLTQKQLGEILGFSARTVSDQDTGNTEPDLSTIKAIVKLFDITYDDFFEGI